MLTVLMGYSMEFFFDFFHGLFDDIFGWCIRMACSNGLCSGIYVAGVYPMIV